MMNRSLLISIIALNLLAFGALGETLRFLADAPRPAQYGFGASALILLIVVFGLSAIALVTNTRPEYRQAAGPPGGEERRTQRFGRRATDAKVAELFQAIAEAEPGPGLAAKIKQANALDLEEP